MLFVKSPTRAQPPTTPQPHHPNPSSQVELPPSTTHIRCCKCHQTNECDIPGVRPEKCTEKISLKSGLIVQKCQHHIGACVSCIPWDEKKNQPLQGVDGQRAAKREFWSSCLALVPYLLPLRPSISPRTTPQPYPRNTSSQVDSHPSIIPSIGSLPQLVYFWSLSNNLPPTTPHPPRPLNTSSQVEPPSPNPSSQVEPPPSPPSSQVEPPPPPPSSITHIRCCKCHHLNECDTPGVRPEQCTRTKQTFFRSELRVLKCEHCMRGCVSCKPWDVEKRRALYKDGGGEGGRRIELCMKMVIRESWRWGSEE